MSRTAARRFGAGPRACVCQAAQSPAEFDALAERSVSRLMDFLERQEIVTVKDYFEPALREHLGSYVPAATRNFFWIAAHYDPTPLYTHFWHWFELARMDREPHASPVRRGALLYNIFDSGNEGTATGVEEMFLHAGLYDASPRSRELVWIMLAQRAARGLGSLYAHANELTMEEAGKVAIGRFVMRNKQYVAALRAQDGKLLMSTMVFADEVVKIEAIDGAGVAKGALRVTFWGVLAMALTAGVGALFGAVV